MLPSPSTGTTTNISPPSNVPTALPNTTSTTTIASSVSAAGPAQAQAPAPATGANPLKRPAASDLQRATGTHATPSKRQATSANNPKAISNPIHLPGPSTPASHAQPPLQPQPQSQPQVQSQPAMPAPAVITEDQLLGRTPEQLIATILQIQVQHQQYVAHIAAQYENINQQLSELRGSLVASYQSAAAALTTREPSMRSIIPPLPVAQQTAVPPPRLTAAQTPSRPARAPPASPSHPVIPRTSAPTPQSSSSGPPAYDYRTVNTVEEVWREYREGMDGQPAVEALDAQWGSRWRPEPRGRTWYSRRKVIWDKIKEYIADGLDEDEAVREVEKLRDGGTVNKLIRLLQDERKDKGVGDDSMVG
ncbi:transcriptional activator of glycolytic enzymes-domain-containing protein [Biscogniauxia marginata]|nr:transcriptional activator of glycolytic enzymes-domain-containing protein [Biscogniauxia marginata]